MATTIRMSELQAENERLRAVLAAIRSEPHHWCTNGQWTDTYGRLGCSCPKAKRDALIDETLALVIVDG